MQEIINNIPFKAHKSHLIIIRFIAFEVFIMCDSIVPGDSVMTIWFNRFCVIFHHHSECKKLILANYVVNCRPIRSNTQGMNSHDLANLKNYVAIA